MAKCPSHFAELWAHSKGDPLLGELGFDDDALAWTPAAGSEASQENNNESQMPKYDDLFMGNARFSPILTHRH